RPHGVRRLSVTQVLGKLHHAHQRQLPGMEGRLAFARVDGGELLVVEEGPQFLTHPHVDISPRKGGLRDVHRRRRDGGQLVTWQAHRMSPSLHFMTSVDSCQYASS